MSWTRLGPIIRTQISSQTLVYDQRYNPQHLVEVDELHLSADGLVGWTGSQALLNHHHRLHPGPKPWKPLRLLSIGFTGHYRAMADRFGAAPVGIAGENLIVDCGDEIVTEDDLAPGLQVRDADGAPVVDLDTAAVAKPCVPFTKFLLEDQDADDETVAPNRAFLEDGMRGFVLGAGEVDEPVTITSGHELWLRD